MRFKYLVLILILLLGSFLRVYRLNQGDVLGDESLLAFRSVELIDFDEAPKQTTPLEWLDGNIPWWTKLSFHDHPPLVFIIQHLFLSAFGQTTWAFRLPSAVFGIASIYLIYLLGRQIMGRATGLLAAVFLAVNTNHIYISRIGLQESYVIFFILLTLYGLLRSGKNPRFLLLVGASLGLGLLTKYTTAVLIPICLVYLAIYNRKLFRSRFFWQSLVLTVIITSPVIIYNLMLYRTVGHFDFQLSYIFGQHPQVWSETPGKEIGSLLYRLAVFPTRLFLTNSPIFLILFFGSLGWLISATLKKRNSLSHPFAPTNPLLFLSLIFLTLLIVLIGPSYRFLTILTPPMALVIGLAIAGFINGAKPKTQKIILGFFLSIIAMELLYSINTNHVSLPRGIIPWTYAATVEETRAYGYQVLEKYFEHELKNLTPALTLEPRYKFLDELQKKTLKQNRSAKYKLAPRMIVYDDNLQSFAQLWYLDRLQVYRAWPVLKLSNYQTILAQNGKNYFSAGGFKMAYFVLPKPGLPLKLNSVSNEGKNFAAYLDLNRSPYASLKNQNNSVVFRVYRFTP